MKIPSNNSTIVELPPRNASGSKSGSGEPFKSRHFVPRQSTFNYTRNLLDVGPAKIDRLFPGDWKKR